MYISSVFAKCFFYVMQIYALATVINPFLLRAFVPIFNTSMYRCVPLFSLFSLISQHLFFRSTEVDNNATPISFLIRNLHPPRAMTHPYLLLLLILDMQAPSSNSNRPFLFLIAVNCALKGLF